MQARDAPDVAAVDEAEDDGGDWFGDEEALPVDEDDVEKDTEVEDKPEEPAGAEQQPEVPPAPEPMPEPTSLGDDPAPVKSAPANGDAAHHANEPAAATVSAAEVELRAQLSELQEKHATATAQAGKVSEERDALRRINKFQSEQLEEATKRADTAEERVAVLEKDAKGQAELLSAREEDVKALTDKAKRADDRAKAVIVQVESREKEIEELKTKLAKQSEDHKAQLEANKAGEGTAAKEVEKLELRVKEEEEKRTKALSLLRALRQKLVKSEKDREELEKERDSLKNVESAAAEANKANRERFDQETVALRASQEQQVSRLRASFEKETTQLRLQFEKDAATRKSQYELEAITTKATHLRELGVRSARVDTLEANVKQLSTSKDALFDQLQVKQAELESSKAHQETLQSEVSEMQYQMSESRDRVAALQEELDELKTSQRNVSRDDGNMRRALSEAEGRHESKTADFERRIKQLERERLDVEQEMTKNLQDRLREVERMRAQLAQKDADYAESVQTREAKDLKIEQAEAEVREVKAKLRHGEVVAGDLRREVEKSFAAESAMREDMKENSKKVAEMEKRLEDIQQKESQLRSTNKSLREEIRKLQEGVLLSENQRRPGVGYFAAYSGSSTNLARSTTSPPASNPASPPPGPSAASAPASARKEGDEALNFEYLRNVIFQFLERPEMRPHLIGVLGVILHFTPAESRKLQAKVGG